MKLFNNFFNQVKQEVVFESPYSWQTPILLSIFSWLMATISGENFVAGRGFISALIATCGWFFLITGFAWFAKEKSLPFAPWITGALVSYFLFSSFTETIPRLAIVLWPIISAGVVLVGASLNDELDLEAPPRRSRQDLVILFGTQLLLSCWLQFFFVTQDWLREYPSLLVEDFSNSGFMVKVDVSQQIVPRGVKILDFLGQELQEELDEEPWSEVEEWLLEEGRQDRIEVLREEIAENLPSIAEDEFWQLNSQASSREDGGYDLQLQANWDGPGSNPDLYNSLKNCALVPAYSNEQALVVGEINCAPAATVGQGKTQPPEAETNPTWFSWEFWRELFVGEEGNN